MAGALWPITEPLGLRVRCAYHRSEAALRNLFAVSTGRARHAAHLASTAAVPVGRNRALHQLARMMTVRFLAHSRLLCTLLSESYHMIQTVNKLGYDPYSNEDE